MQPVHAPFAHAAAAQGHNLQLALDSGECFYVLDGSWRIPNLEVGESTELGSRRICGDRTGEPLMGERSGSNRSGVVVASMPFTRVRRDR